MDDVAASVLEFIRCMEGHQFPPDLPTHEVVRALRERLDADAPGWRARVFRDAPEGVEVEVVMGDGRVVRGALARRPSAVTGEAA